MRFPLMVIDAVRNAVGSDFIVGVRATGDELVTGGLTADDCVVIAKTLAASGAVDFLNVLAGAPVAFGNRLIFPSSMPEELQTLQPHATQ